jgi:Ulp1 family protease
MATGNYTANQWIPESGLEGYSYILVPVVESNHWTLGVIKCSDRAIFIMDSVYTTPHSNQAATIKQFAQAALPGDWTIHIAKGLPRQKGAHNCGVFVVMVRKWHCTMYYSTCVPCTVWYMDHFVHTVCLIHCDGPANGLHRSK